MNMHDELYAGPELCVVLPTYNERDNIAQLVNKLTKVLSGLRWEVIVVDDNSPDGTADIVYALGKTDYRVRAIRRIARRGLSSAVIEGMLATNAPVIAVMDADHQHDENLLPEMYSCLNTEDYHVVVASREIHDGAYEGLSPSRQRISKFSNQMARQFTRSDIKDMMSGFFMVRRDVIHQTAPEMSGLGFKILVDLLASSPTPLRVKELPYVFGKRISGTSKLDAQAASAFVLLLLDKKLGKWLPARFIAFAAVGSVGVIVHYLVLSILHVGADMSFEWGQILATLVAMTSNFVLNNLFTYSYRRLTGWSWVRGWVSFALISAVGAIGNVGAASALFNQSISWQWAALAGILIGVVWNFAVSRVFTWRN